MEATIVKLGPSDQLVGVCTFEEAFGEHSELRGRGRARRQKRRQTRRLTRLKNKQERKRLKQEIRNENQEARQSRRDTAKSRRVARKAMGDEEDVEDPNATEDTAVAPDDSSTDQGYSEDTASEDQGSEDSGYEDSGEEGPEPYDFENGSGADGSDDEDYAEARGGRRSRGKRGLGSRMRARRAERKAPPVEEMESAEVGGEEVSGATGAPVKNIHPQIKDTTKRIVWNREALRRHKLQHAKYSQAYAQKMQTPALRARPNHPHIVNLRQAIDKHSMEIQKHEERLSALEKMLSTRFSGHPHIEHGYKLANIELQKQLEGSRNNQTQATIKDTLVDRGLGAEIETNRIDVPAQPEMRTIELSSNASGEESKKGMSTPTKVVIGVAALGIAYYFAKKYKVI